MIVNDVELARRMASRCGDCGRLFDEIRGGGVYVRQQPARLICQDCKLKEAPMKPWARY